MNQSLCKIMLILLRNAISYEEMLVETTSPSPRVTMQDARLTFSRLLLSALLFDLFLDFTIREILTNPSEVQQFMQNLSIPPSVAEGLLNSTVNSREVRVL